MDFNDDRYIIIEIIPTGISRDKGCIAQISALKLEGLNLLGRFDYRLNEDKIEIPDILKIINYDKEQFIYVDNDRIMLDNFINWSENLPLLIIDNDYTRNFLSELSNSKEDIFKYLEIESTVDVIERLMKRYNLQPSNHIVDLLYESLIHKYSE